MALSDWSALPLRLLGDIALKLDTLEDFIYFSTVCRCWNRASSSIKHQWRRPTPVPWLLLAENTKDNRNCIPGNNCYKFPLPETFGARCSGSAYGWVAMIDRHFNVQLLNPITKARIQFPSLEKIPRLPLYDEKFNESKEDYITWCLSFFVEKLVVLKTSDGCRHEFVIMVFDSEQAVNLAKPGDNAWASIVNDKPKERYMVDVAVMGDQVFALYTDGKLVYWNASDFFNLEFEKQIDYSPSQPHIFEVYTNYAVNQTYLVQSGSELIMVIRHKEAKEEVHDYDINIVCQTRGFDIYKVNRITKLWEKIEELCDEALLLGCNSSMSVSTASGICLQGNCIYFSDDETQFRSVVTKSAGHDMGVYDIKTDKIFRFYEGDDMLASFCPPTLFIPRF